MLIPKIFNQCLKIMPCCKKFSLTDCSLDDEECAVLVGGLQHCSALEELVLNGNKITDYEKQKSNLENEMLLENFYEAKNQKRIQEVNIELKSLINLITEEEKNWEELAVKIEKLN